MPPGGIPASEFGHSIALSGDRAVIGAPDDHGNGPLSGAAYVFRVDPASGTWIEEAKLLASDGESTDHFGTSVAIHGDIVVGGAPRTNDNGRDSGSAYVFRYDAGSGVWTEEAKLLPSNGSAYDYFGYSVALFDETILIGVSGDDDAGNDSGSAHVYRYDAGSGTWKEEAKLLASDGAAGDFFGESVSLSGDLVAIGACQDDDNGDDSGSVYVFRFDSGSGTWKEETKLLSSDGESFDSFGNCVVTAGDLIAIGALGDDDCGSSSGSAYLFGYDPGSATWTEEAKLIASDGESSALFGNALSLSEEYLVVGAYRDSGIDGCGAAYLFQLDQGTGTWQEKHKLLPSDGTRLDKFGLSVGLSARHAFVGSPWHGDNQGTVYLYGLIDRPLLDIKCNEQDENVVIPGGANVTLDVAVASGDFAGFPVDIWILARSVTGGSVWSFGSHGAPAWLPGWGNVYFTGGLFDFSATVLDRPLPIGVYAALLVLELNPNGVPETNYVYDFDAVNFLVLP